MSHFSRVLEALPVPMLGLAFGICTLGWNIEIFYSLNGYLQAITAILAFIIISLVITKLLSSKSNLWQLQCDPAVGPMLAIIPMTIMVVSTNLPQDLSVPLWTFGLGLHLLILTSFIVSRVKHFNFAQVSPAWFIPTIGLAIAPLVNPNENQFLLDQLILLFCTLMYFLLLPLVSYRLIKLGTLPAPNRPVMALFAAPPNLCLVGYILLIPTPSMNYIAGLTILAICMTLFCYYNIVRQLKDQFFPSISAFTFPLVIGAAAMRTCAEFFEQLTPANELLITVFNSLAIIQILISAAVTLLVCYRYFKHLSQPQEINHSANASS